MYGFSAQLNNFGIENMETQIAHVHQVMASPAEVELPQPAAYYAEGIDTIFAGFEYRDFPSLDYTLKHIGNSFTF